VLVKFLPSFCLFSPGELSLLKPEHDPAPNQNIIPDLDANGVEIGTASVEVTYLYAEGQRQQWWMQICPNTGLRRALGYATRVHSGAALGC
jgi:hypothetical protein